MQLLGLSSITPCEIFQLQPFPFIFFFFTAEQESIECAHHGFFIHPLAEAHLGYHFLASVHTAPMDTAGQVTVDFEE